ncbi:MAG: GtrA family protein [Pseudomonadota bacterium]
MASFQSLPAFITDTAPAINSRMNLRLRRFFRYTAVGCLTFLFDLLLLWIQIEKFHVYYLYAAVSSFLIAVSVNYILSRRWVFKGSARRLAAGYLYFFKTAVAGALTTGFLMWMFCHSTNESYLPIRVIIAGIIGMGNYLIHLFLNFRVAGHEL